MISIFAMLILIGCSSDEPCEYCRNSPSKDYKLKSGENFYVCDDCGSECMLCGDKAQNHYESLMGIVFACDDCYEEIKEINEK